MAWRIIRLVILRTLVHWLDPGWVKAQALTASQVTYKRGEQILRGPFAGLPILCRRRTASHSSSQTASGDAGSTAEIKMRLVLPRRCLSISPLLSTEPLATAGENRGLKVLG